MVKITRREIRADFMPYKIEIEIASIEKETELHSIVFKMRTNMQHYYKAYDNDCNMSLFLNDIIKALTNK